MTTKLYTVAELADVLGESERTLRERIYRGEIAHIDVGTVRRPRLRVTQDALDAYSKAVREVRRDRHKTYKVAELAEIFGENERTTRQRIYRGEIAHINIGTKLRPRMRITQEALDAYLERLAAEVSA